MIEDLLKLSRQIYPDCKRTLSHGPFYGKGSLKESSVSFNQHIRTGFVKNSVNTRKLS